MWHLCSLYLNTSEALRRANNVAFNCFWLEQHVFRRRSGVLQFSFGVSVWLQATSLPTVRLVSDLRRVWLLFDTSRRLRVGVWGVVGWGWIFWYRPSLTPRDIVGIGLFVAWLIILCRIQLQMMPGGEWEVRDGKNNEDWPDDTTLTSLLFCAQHYNLKMKAAGVSHMI